MSLKPPAKKENTIVARVIDLTAGEIGVCYTVGERRQCMEPEGVLKGTS